MVSVQISVPGYQIREEVYNGSRTLVYRGVREADSLPVVIKLLKNPYPNFSELVQFRNQYTIAKNLDFPEIIQTISLEPFQNGYMLVMEDFGGISLADYFSRNFKTRDISFSGEFLEEFLEEFLKISISLCDGLNILYQQRIIHKDIKPSNILINPHTKQVKLIDFSIATLLPQETQSLKNPNVLEGTLAYISPEQTGRMNRGIDYRTDFYSLGVTFYELLTGNLPFIANDPMELVHNHIAKIPPQFEKGEIPQALANIVMKLMAKNAEDRYQSALGLKHDLETCLEQLQENGEIVDFEIAKKDICDRFLIPDKLYGREAEVETLLNGFEGVSNGASELMLVAGFSGIGKTAVVNEIHKPIVRQRGYFIKGKYDQFNRNIPFSAFVQAFRDLMRQLLTESDIHIQEWKAEILGALGENGQVIIDVIPELERIIGKQPPVPELSGTAAQNRFNLLFNKFIQVFATFEHPLVMFLDDLQWADSASLQLMQLLIGESKINYLLMIGAYRDNEVSIAHPLILTLDEIEKRGKVINSITLKALSQESLNDLVVDTLNCSVKSAHPLTELIYQKTQGNPFFSTQFLKALHQDGLIRFSDRGVWECDISQVQQAALTDDVVEFMSAQLQKLPSETQEVLKLAACIGNHFDLNTLAIVSEKSELDAATDLWTALQAGLVLPQNEIYKFYQGENKEQLQQISEGLVSYKFLHDRVQQAAYSLIFDDQKQVTHLHIGQLLLQKFAPSEREERLFEIVNHLNIGRALIAQPQERENLVQLNLEAGRKAKISTAYKVAIAYLSTGIELLPDTAWESHYSLSLALHEEITEASYLNIDFEQMEKWADLVLQRAKNLLDTIKVQQTRIMGAKAQGKLVDSLNIGLEVLKELGIKFPKQPTQEDIQEAYRISRSHWIDKPPLSLLALPTMSDSRLLAAMNMLTVLTPAAYLVSPNLMLLLIFKQVELSIKSGNAPVSIFAYCDYGLILCGIMGDIPNGYEFGELSFGLLAKLQAKSFQGRSGYVVNTYIKHWKICLSEIVTNLQVAYRNSLETGDIEALGCNASAYCTYLYHQGQNLTEIAQTMEAYRQTIIKYQLAIYLPWQEIYQQTVLNLLGQTTIPYILTGEIFNQEKSLPQLQASNQRTILFFWFFNQTILYYLFEKNNEAIQASAETAKYLDGATGMFVIPLYYWFEALIELAQCTNISQAQECQSILFKVEQHQAKLHYWATLSPVNHQHRWQLVEAERYRVLGNKIDAIEAYDHAIAGAKANGFIQDEALANELAAKFYLNLGKDKVAAGYIQEAYYCYTRWGATAKVADLESRYPELLYPILQQTPTSTDALSTLMTITAPGISPRYHTHHSSSSNSINQAFDFAAILKASQTLSRTIQLDELIHQLTQIILENSGAKKAVLILPQENIWQVRAITSINHQNNTQNYTQTILESQSLEACQDIPRKIINYVRNTQEIITINNCQTDIPGLIGEYMGKHRPKSVLCMPIINQGNLIGIFYLENKITSGVFSSERLQIINLLSSQAAISLENAQLYQKTQQALEDLQQAQLQIIQSEKMSALGNLVAGVAHEMNNPLGFISATLKQAKPTFMEISEHLKLCSEKITDADIIDHAEEIDLDYSLEDFPKMLDAMIIACERLKHISTSLRTFSRADKDYKVKFNLHEGIDSTILILKHRLKANEQRPAIKVITNYGNLPQIDCFPGQLNQVFMNILANAIDMFDEIAQTQSFKELEANPQIITIHTEVFANQVYIRIFDNGKGMSEEVKAKIFDHLFTTKGVGKGTGLGLAIARQIIAEKHCGSLDVWSELGQGTEFTIKIPL